MIVLVSEFEKYLFETLQVARPELGGIYSKDYIYAGFKSEIPKKVKGVKVNGHLSQRLPNNAHFSFEQLQSESLLMSLDMANISASMGSACTSGALEPSHVLRAIGLSDDLAYGALRITLGRQK